MLKNIIKKQGGFTLLELLIVIVIIGILALLIIPNITSAPKKARDTQRKTDLKSVQKALEEYFVSNNTYPSVSGTVLASTALSGSANGTGTTGPLTTGTAIMKKVPVDPKNAPPLIYNYTSDGTTYTLHACLEDTGATGDGISADTNCGTNGKAFTLNASN